MLEPTAEMPEMSDYGVNDRDWLPLPWQWAAERLARTHNYWLSTVSAVGQPHSMPVWGVWHEPAQQWAFGCSPTSQKARNIATNHRVTVTNDDTVECVSVQGTAVLELDAAVIDSWVDLFVAKYGHEIGPDYGDFMRSHPLFVVTPTTAFGIIERVDEFSTRATRWRFEPHTTP